ncbi:hypothetical protein HanHA300_Chr10g0363581 [Helianthus annuus]|nr:hypothetical protein HanHA300_Chr10g0363581 [Helianthus annuus]KAJ0530059.1 hypothetical protein HanHA89_Chr10g0385271 [Helianthus annuus]KAJ0696917.1 hypothetical protein HanLR1_Chr10g0362811 [Helianthus annuus]
MKCGLLKATTDQMCMNYDCSDRYTHHGWHPKGPKHLLQYPRCYQGRYCIEMGLFMNRVSDFQLIMADISRHTNL